MKKLTSKLVVALGLLAGYTIQMSTAAAQCCVTIPATNNTALINISVPWAINDDFTAADNSAVFVDQVLAPAPIPAGNYPGWCIDVPDNIGNGPTVYNTTLYSSCDSNLNSELPTNYPASVYVSPATWHTINYILNHRGTNYFWDVQNAIWYFIGGPVPAGLGPPTYPPTNPATVTAIVNDALTNAPAWQSQCGDVVAVIVAVNVLPHDQLTMIEVPCNCCSGEIGDYIWQDLNGNGCQDAGEPGIAGVKVDLYSGACGTTGTLVATTNTDSTGHYLFSGLCAGSYQVVITTPAGFTATKPNQGCTNPSLPPYENQLDSKCNCAGASPCVNCVTLTSGNLTNLNVDCGYVPQLSLQCSGGSGTVGVPYTFVLPVSGGCAPYTFSIISGALPGGLMLNPSTGVISGTPTNAGTFSYTAQVKDSCGDTATTSGRNCSITIMPPLIIGCAGGSGTLGVPYSGTLSVVGGCAPYTFKIISGALPGGLTLNTNTGVISGTPTNSGMFLYIAQVTDSCGHTATTASENCGILISPPCLLAQLGAASGFSVLGLHGANIQLSSGPLKVNGNVGIGVNGLVHLSGGATLQSTVYADPTATVQIDNGSSFSGGTVKEPFAAIQAAALAESSAAAMLPPTQTFSQIQNAITIVGNGGQNVIAVNGQLHLSSGQNLTISGGPNDTFIFNISQGFQLDGGASIVLKGVAPNQVLFNFPGTGQQVQTSGNANTAGIFLAPLENIQINGGTHTSVFISGGQISFQSNPVINQMPACGPTPLTLSCVAAGAGTVGVPFSSTLPVSGGCAPYSFSIISGTLPPGLTLNPVTGAVTGTPTMSIASSYVAQVTDSCGNTATTAGDNCGITITTCTPCVNTALGLGAAGTTTVLELGAAQVSLNGPAGGIIGNVYIAPNGQANWSGGGEYLDGNVYLGAGAQYQNSGVIINGSIFYNQNLTAQINAAYAAYSNYITLPATSTYTSASSIPDTVGAGKTNVVDVAGDLHPNGNTVAITGSAGSLFIIRVHGQLKLDGGGQIRAVGGVLPENIIYVVVGSGADVGATGGGGGSNCCNAVYDGTILAPYRNIALSPGLVNGEIISGQNISIVSGSGVHCPVCSAGVN